MPLTLPDRASFEFLKLYAVLKERQLRVSTDGAAARHEAPSIPFQEDLYTPFYGGRQFSIRDRNGCSGSRTGSGRAHDLMIW